MLPSSIIVNGDSHEETSKDEGSNPADLSQTLPKARSSSLFFDTGHLFTPDLQRSLTSILHVTSYGCQRRSMQKVEKVSQFYC